MALIDEIYEYTGSIYSEKLAKCFQNLIDKKIEEDRRRICQPLVEYRKKYIRNWGKEFWYERVDQKYEEFHIEETIKRAGLLNG